MKLDPVAGSLKTSGSERVIPLHPALVDHGDSYGEFPIEALFREICKIPTLEI
jgi:hypothetical protein